MKMAGFRWNAKRSQAAILLADGYTIKETAEAVNTAERSVYRWKTDSEFSAEVDRLSIMTGIASKAERMRIAKRLARQRVNPDGSLISKADLLEILRYAQSETDGVKLDLAELLTSLTAHGASVAGSGPTGDDPEDAADDADTSSAGE